LPYSKEQLFQLKGELTYNIEVLNQRLVEVNRQLVAIINKEAGNGQDHADSKLGDSK